MNTIITYSKILFINTTPLNNKFLNKRDLSINLCPKLKKNLLNDNNMPILYANKNLNNNIYSIEHIYPISYLITEESKNDMHNLIKTTKTLNNARSNYKFTDFEENIKINEKKWLLLENNNYVNHKDKLFIPNIYSKGKISRAILYINDKYNLNIEKVIDLNILITWYMLYPPDYNEKYHNKYIKYMQNTDNKFISNYKYYKIKLSKYINSL